MTIRNKTFYAMVFLGSVLVVAVDIYTVASVSRLLADIGIGHNIAAFVAIFSGAFVLTCFFDLALRIVESVNDEVIK